MKNHLIIIGALLILASPVYAQDKWKLQTSRITSNLAEEDAHKQWLAADLKKVDPETPIIISTHVPFLSVYYPALQGKYTATDTFKNFKEIWDMLIAAGKQINKNSMS